MTTPSAASLPETTAPITPATAARHLAMHGFQLTVPADWDLVTTKGHWDGGHFVLISERLPRLNVTWDRRKMQVDLPRTLKALSKAMPGTTAGAPQELGNDSFLIPFQAAGRTWHAAVLKPDPNLPLTIVLRQLVPGPASDLRLIAKSLIAWPDDSPCPWTLHGLDLTFPAWWRLEGIAHMVGLVRGVWIHHPNGRRDRTDELVAVRRFACASRLVGEGTHNQIKAWLDERLAKKEQIRDHSDNAGVSSFVLEDPGDTLFKRLRGKRGTRWVHAWTEPEWDRLMIQECRSAEDTIPPLRRDPRPKDAAFPPAGDFSPA